MKYGVWINSERSVYDRGAGLAQWWEHSPSTNVARDRFLDCTSYVGWVCWFSTLLREIFSPGTPVFPPLLKKKKTKQNKTKQNKKNPTFACVAQLASARLSEQRVPSSILGDFNVCFDFLLIRVTIALNIRETDHWQRGRRGVKDALAASFDTT